MLSDATVYIIEPDRGLRSGWKQGLAGERLTVETYSSAEAFLESARPTHPGCVLLEVHLPGVSGLELQRQLSERGKHFPFIFVTANGDIPSAVRAMKLGAVDFLEKPVSEETVKQHVQRSLRLDRTRYAGEIERSTIVARLALLSRREREVLDGLVAGGSNQSVADGLGLSRKTVEMHRANVMKKMRADSLAALLRAYFSVAPERLIAAPDAVQNGLPWPAGA